MPLHIDVDMLENSHGHGRTHVRPGTSSPWVEACGSPGPFGTSLQKTSSLPPAAPGFMGLSKNLTCRSKEVLAVKTIFALTSMDLTEFSS